MAPVARRSRTSALLVDGGRERPAIHKYQQQPANTDAGTFWRCVAQAGRTADGLNAALARALTLVEKLAERC